MEKHIKKAPRVELAPDIEKILAAIQYIISEAHKKKFPITQYRIVKTIFLADKSHLNTYGRPVTFDNYIAMKDGPVPTLVYDLLKEHPNKLSKYNIKSLPWTRTKAPEITSTSYVFSLKKPFVDKDVLSDSDIKALSSALAAVESLTFAQIRKLTHGDPAYMEAWGLKEDTQHSYPMSFGLLFDAPDYDAAEQLKFLSQHK